MLTHKRRTLDHSRSVRAARHRQRLTSEIKALIFDEIMRQFSADSGSLRIAGLVERVFHQFVRLHQQQLGQDQWNPPARSTMFRYVRAATKTDAKNHIEDEKAVGVTNPREESQQDSVNPGVCWEIIQITPACSVVDDWQLPLGKLTLTCCLDRATGYLLGYSLAVGSFSPGHVLDCLLRTILTQAEEEFLYPGSLLSNLPSLLVLYLCKSDDLDSQWFYPISSRLRMVLEKSEQTPPRLCRRRQQLKHALNKSLALSTLSGKCTTQPSSDKRKYAKGYPLIETDELEQVVKAALIEDYNQRFSRDLSETPKGLWQRARQSGIIPMVSLQRESIEILLSQQTVHRFQRRGLGILLHGLWYTSAELRDVQSYLNGRPVIIRYLPTDLSHLYVLHPADGSFITVWAVDYRYTRDLALWRHEAQRRRRPPSVLWIDNGAPLS